MSLQRASPNVQISDDNLFTCGIEKVPEVLLHSILRETVSDGKDPECVRVGWKWIVGWLCLESCGHKDSGCNAKDSFHGV